MSDYSQGKIYLIYLPGLEECGYVGSTIQHLYDRMACHRNTAKSETCPYKYASCVLFEEGNEVCMKLLEAYSCNTKQELLERERYWLQQYPEAVNKNPPILTEEERKARHKELHLISYNKKKEHNLQKHREWIEAHKAEEAEKKKQKRLANLEEARAKERESREKRKDKANEAKRVKVECPVCKKGMNKNSIPLHIKSVHKEIC